MAGSNNRGKKKRTGKGGALRRVSPSQLSTNLVLSKCVSAGRGDRHLTSRE